MNKYRPPETDPIFLLICIRNHFIRHLSKWQIIFMSRQDIFKWHTSWQFPLLWWWYFMVVFLNIFNLSIKSKNVMGNKVNSLEFKINLMQTIDRMIFQRHNHIIFQINFSNNIHIFFIQIFFVLIFFTQIIFKRIIYLYIFVQMWLKNGIIWFRFSWKTFFLNIVGIVIFGIPIYSFSFLWVCFIIFWCEISLVWASYTW